jgi:hypothetical protein
MGEDSDLVLLPEISPADLRLLLFVLVLISIGNDRGTGSFLVTFFN